MAWKTPSAAGDRHMFPRQTNKTDALGFGVGVDVDADVDVDGGLAMVGVKAKVCR